MGKYGETFAKIDSFIQFIWDQNSIFEINFTTRYGFPITEPVTRSPEGYFDEFDLILKNDAFWKDPRSLPELIPLATTFILNSKT